MYCMSSAFNIEEDTEHRLTSAVQNMVAMVLNVISWFYFVVVFWFPIVI